MERRENQRVESRRLLGVTNVKVNNISGSIFEYTWNSQLSAKSVGGYQKKFRTGLLSINSSSRVTPIGFNVSQFLKRLCIS